MTVGDREMAAIFLPGSAPGVCVLPPASTRAQRNTKKKNICTPAP